MPRFIERLWDGIVSLCLAGAFVLVWSGSAVFGAGAAGRFVLIIVMEFVLLLVGISLAAIALEYQERGKVKTCLLMAGAFLVFAGAVSFEEGAWWPLAAAVMLVTSRLRLLFHVPADEEERREIVVGPAGRLGLLFVLLWATAFLPFPAWGVQPLGKDASIYSRHPQRALALGAIYYGLVGLFVIVTSIEAIRNTHNRKD